jgi:hypothetical protein
VFFTGDEDRLKGLAEHVGLRGGVELGGAHRRGLHPVSMPVNPTLTRQGTPRVRARAALQGFGPIHPKPCKSEYFMQT